ncbi:unnamed protein product [Camellia sinensis]
MGANMVTKNFIVDLNKPLVSQVGHLGEAYEEWVHQPVVSKEGPRLFENDILEVWWAIPIVWLPVVCWFVSKAVEMGVPSTQIVVSLVGGIFFWTLLEYCLHRFLFHIKTNGYWGNTLHYLLHGCHHKHPMDRLRLVFPPAGATCIAVPRYIMYDCTHYYVHHGKPNKGVSSNLKRFHMNHHFRIHDKGFGITSSFWDIVFGTPPPKSSKESM